MKTRTITQTFSTIPSKCQHEWRKFGTRMEESVNYPIRDSKPSGYYGGWVICDKCGWSPFVNKFNVIGKRPYKSPFKGTLDIDGFWQDDMVEIVEWGNEKEPVEPVVEEYAYAELTRWERFKKWVTHLLI
jgi:hypothetical protein